MYKIEDLTDRQLRRLRRKDLLVILLDQAKQIEALEQTLQEKEQTHRAELSERDARCAERLAAQEQLAEAKLAALAERQVDIKTGDKASDALYWFASRVYAAVQTLRTVIPGLGGEEKDDRA